MDLPGRIILARVALAALLGVLIGLDRQHLHKPAGVRTMLMVALGSAVFTLVGLEIAGMSTPRGVDALSRVIQGIIGGVGFLGAGVMIRDRGHVRGVTTAAGIWVTAGVGVACGLGAYLIAVIAAAVAIATFTSSRFIFPGDEHPGGDRPADG
ncbi:MAG: MgtC/SapB family protein [Phycisphaeraceae bacterium]|nr:MAG: MgtC/SapB family protein [Phycisphaeraceae bacterium]